MLALLLAPTIAENVPPCAVNADCGSGKYCYAAGTANAACVNDGMLGASPPATTTCAVNADCGSGRYCYAAGTANAACVNDGMLGSSAGGVPPTGTAGGGNASLDNGTCSTGHVAKNSSVAVHHTTRAIPLFPIDWRDIVGSIVAILFAAFANAGGIGGGGLFVPLLILVFGLQVHYAIPLSKVMVFGGALTRFVSTVTARHPSANRPIINYEVVLLFQPIILVGTTVGVMLNRILPAILILILLTLLLSATTIRTCRKGRKMWKAESKERLERGPGVTKGVKAGSNGSGGNAATAAAGHLELTEISSKEENDIEEDDAANGVDAGSVKIGAAANPASQVRSLHIHVHVHAHIHIHIHIHISHSHPHSHFTFTSTSTHVRNAIVAAPLHEACLLKSFLDSLMTAATNHPPLIRLSIRPPPPSSFRRPSV